MLENIYTSFKEAKKALWERWHNRVLRRDISEFFQEQIPKCLKEAPRAILARSVATPNFESIKFYQLSNKELLPLFLEHHQDKFTIINSDKVSLVKLGFYNGRGRNGGTKLKYVKVADLTEIDGCFIDKIKTFSGETLVDLHHRFFTKIFPEIEKFDMSRWLNNFGGKASRFYSYFLSLFVCHGILFENFDDGIRGRFTYCVVMPAINSVIRRFGYPPLIVRLLPDEIEKSKFWTWYPGSLENDINTFF